ncbi:DUF397 domain-containing protein [Streptomyces niger]|uniref:DUF397 domain-containing protein n=1 Tax=Streptomyces niger TaxID=66373 RepID=UPI00069B7A58|nr:DUF397 domain-containing protein [Streptomyces niger]
MPSSRPEHASAVWRKSSYSDGGGGDCVEVGSRYIHVGLVPVRDSKNPAGPVLTFSAAAWNAFVNGVKEGGAGVPGPLV